MSKLLGHPDIQSRDGLDKLRKRANQSNPVSPSDVTTLLCSLKKNFLQHYFLRHKKWPPLTTDYLTCSRIRYAISHNLWITDAKIPENIPLVNLVDFTHVELGKVQEFDYIDSMFPILKDTALAPVREVILNPDLNRVTNLKDQRTLLYFTMIDLNSKHPDALIYLVIKLTQKEKELKEEGRMFGQSPFVERARRCILEYNISKLIKKYSPSQAMLLSDIQKLKKMHTLASTTESKTPVIAVTISIDVEAFNNNFRRLICEPIGREFFNKVFGVNFSVNIMDTFENSVFIIDDGVFDVLYLGQYGGIEGLFQKFWTWVYESVASRLAEMTGYQYFLMVNGDDLRVVLIVPHSEINEGLKNKLDEILLDFEQNYEKFGFRFKLQETYYSSELFGFGKVYLYRGAFCSGVLKKGIRIHGFANLTGDYPLEVLKGIMSETLSTMSYSTSHRYIYYAGLIRFQYALTQSHPDYVDLENQERLTIMLFPSNFGGLPMLPYLRCLYKGESDVETCWISLYIHLLEDEPQLARNLFSLLSSYIITTPDWTQFVKNPYGLPNDSPSEGQRRLKSFIRNRLPSIVKNRNFLKVLQKTSPSHRNKFIERLVSCDPLPAREISVLYESSAAGVVDEFVDKFISSKSIAALMTGRFKRRRCQRLLAGAKQDDIDKISSVIHRVKIHPSILVPPIEKILFKEKNLCPTNLMDKLREFCLGKRVIGLTYPCPVDQLLFFDTENMTGFERSDYFSLTRSTISPSIDVNYSLENHSIHLGNHTHLKLINPEIELKQISPGVRRVKNILKVYSLMKNLGPDCEEYLKQNLRDLTGIDPDLLLSVSYKSRSGTTAHRVPSSHWSPLSGPNSLSNNSTYLHMTTNTDHLTRVRGGDQSINYGRIL